MKPAPIVLVLGAATLLAAGVVLTRTREGGDPVATAGVVDVDQLATSPSEYAGREIRLAGVVSAVQPGKRLFAVIDRSEYAACEVVTCSQYQIPVTYAGDLPAVEATVTATGHLTQPEPGRYLFLATSVEWNP